MDGVGDTGGVVASYFRWGNAVENQFTCENIQSEGPMKHPNRGVQQAVNSMGSRYSREVRVGNTYGKSLVQMVIETIQVDEVT